MYQISEVTDHFMNEIDECLGILAILIDDFDSLDNIYKILISFSGVILKDLQHDFEEEGTSVIFWLI